MPAFTESDEIATREALKLRAQKPGVLGADFPVYIARFVVSDTVDLAKKISVAPSVAGQAREIKYLLIELVAVNDTEGDAIDCPGAELVYNFHLFVGFREKDANGAPFGNSTNEFNALLIRLRNEFSLSDKVFEARRNVTSEPLDENNFIIIGDDPISGAEGHFIDKSLTIDFD